MSINIEENKNNDATMNNENFDIVEYTKNKREELMKCPEVENLTSLIELDNPNSVLVFGKEASEGIAKVSDSLLNTIKINKNEDQSKMLVSLTKIMDKFDIEDFSKTKEPNFLEKVFKKANSAVELMFKKYETLGDEVVAIQIELDKYSNEIKKSNEVIDKLINENMICYNELQKYLAAISLANQEMDEKILPHYKEIADRTMDQMDSIKYQEVLQMSDMIRQREYDLKIAENIAIQTIPMLNAMKTNNYGLVRKINSAFVITLPTFKQCLTQAVLIKKQELQAQSLKTLDDKTNELLVKNAQNVTRQSIELTRMNYDSSINIETLEKMYNIIRTGIDETMKIEEDGRNLIKENTKKLESLNETLYIGK